MFKSVDPETVTLIRGIFLVIFCVAWILPSAIDILKDNRK